jgi:hypothetical protein
LEGIGKINDRLIGHIGTQEEVNKLTERRVDTLFDFSGTYVERAIYDLERVKNIELQIAEVTET